MKKLSTNLIYVLWGMGCLSGTAWGQPTQMAVNVSWLPVTEEEKVLKAPVVEKDAGLEAIFWRVHVRDERMGDEIQRVLYHYMRLKVFNEKGKEAASTIEIEYSNEVAVMHVAGRTILPDGTVLDLKGDDIRDKELVRVGRIRRKVKSFAMPGVVPGAIVEYRWKESRFKPDSLHFRAQMQTDYPVRKVTYFLQPLQAAYDAGYQMTVRPFNCQPTKLKLENDGFHSFSLDNVPAFRAEPLMFGEPKVRPWVLVAYTDGSQKNPEKYWEKEGKDAYKDMKTSLKVNNEMKAAAAAAVGAASTDEEKVAALVRYVRSNIRNLFASNVTDAERGKVIKSMPKNRRRTSEEVLKSGIATPNEMNILFAALASSVGLEARQAFLSNRDDLQFHPNLVDTYFLRNVDMAVRAGDSWKIYDVSARLLPPNMLTWREEGTTAFITDNQKPEFVQTKTSSPEDSKVQRIARLTMSPDGTIEGTVGLSFTGHKAYEERLGYDGDTPEKQQQDLKEEITSSYPDAEVSDIAIENVSDPEQPLKVRYKIRIPGYAQRTGKRLIFQPVFFQRGTAPLFAATERKYPVDLRYGWSEMDNVMIELPEGYVLDSAENPGDIDFGPPGIYQLQMARNGNRTLAVSRGLTFGRNGMIMFPVASYAALKRAFDEIHNRDATSLVLKEAAAGAVTQ